MNENANSLKHPQKERKELWRKYLSKAMDRESTTITGMDANKNETYSGNP